MKNLNFSKNNENKHRLMRLNALFQNVFSFCGFQLSQNRKSIFFCKTVCQNQFESFWKFSKKIKKEYFDFSKLFFQKNENFKNLKANKNPRKNRVRIVRLGRLKTLFYTIKIEKLRFLRFLDNRFIYFEKSESV